MIKIVIHDENGQGICETARDDFRSQLLVRHKDITWHVEDENHLSVTIQRTTLDRITSMIEDTDFYKWGIIKEIVKWET